MLTKRRFRYALARLALAAVSLAVAACAFAQSYGPGDQVLSLGHAAFHPADSGFESHTAADGYIYGAGAYVASVVLPEGAVVTQLCI